MLVDSLEMTAHNNQIKKESGLRPDPIIKGVMFLVEHTANRLSGITI